MSADITAATASVPGPSLGKTALFYLLTIGGGIALFFLVRAVGEGLVAPAPTPSAAHAAGTHGSVFWHALLVLAVVTLAARGLGWVFERWLRQPPVIGEIVAGIALGPSVLGALSPGAQAFLLPNEVAPYLGVIAKIGVVLFMFLVGLELDLSVLRGRQHATLAISHASIIVPFALGGTLALALYPVYGQSGMTFTTFALFCGVSMSVTAFPVLARILNDRKMTGTPLGVMAIACAAVDDATAWCLLAFVSGVARAELGDAGITLLFVLGHALAVWLLARPLVRWLSARVEKSDGPVSIDVLAIVFAGLLLSAVATEAIGIHALFGAFLFGAMIPHEGKLAAQLKVRIEDVVGVLLLPVFFAFTGMRTEIGLLDSSRDWLFTGLIILVATAGKLGGSVVAARVSGMGWRDSSALGVLMNTRGLMELIVLNVGLEMGVLSPRLFTMMVVMALVTTFTTSPVLSLLAPRRASTPPAPA